MSTTHVLNTKPKVIAENGPKGRMELNGHPIRIAKKGRKTLYGVAIQGNLYEVKATGPMVVTCDLSAKPIFEGRDAYREGSKAASKADLTKVPACEGSAPKEQAVATFTNKPEPKAQGASDADQRIARLEKVMESIIAKLS
jgi:hypothetical protein